MDRNKKHIQPKTRNMASLSFHKVNMKVFSSFSNRMQPELLLLPIIFMAMVSADLQNPDFELPPSNLPENSTATFVLLDGNNTIPGWTFEGTVQYVTSGTTMSLPGNGHAIQLGLDGKINQTFIANADIMNYILTFTLAPGGQNCSSNADIIVSAPDSRAMFSVKQSYGMETWESYGHYLGSWGDEEPINLIIQSQTTESDANSTCWPIIDTLLLNKFGTLVQGKDNLLLNGGFELGPVFLSNSNQGILLDPEPSPVQSALQQWSVIGTVRYINSKHYFVPEGNAAIEIVSGISTGIQTAKTLTQGDSYHLEFSLGDANDSCVGDFIVGAQAGSTVQNITLQNKGTGSAKKFSMTFKADSSPTPISFLSYTSSQTKDGVFCGPVVDDVILHASNGMKLNPWDKNPVHILIVLAILLVIIEKY